MPDDTVPFVLPVPGGVDEELLISFNGLRPPRHVVRNVSFLHLRFLLVLHLVSSFQTPLEVVDDELLADNRRLDALQRLSNTAFPMNMTFLALPSWNVKSSFSSWSGWKRTCFAVRR